jgi:hypothetical protein
MNGIIDDEANDFLKLVTWEYIVGTLQEDSGFHGILNIASTVGGNVISGPQSFSGQVELTGQAATYGTSAMTRALVEARRAVSRISTNTTIVTNSATYGSAYMTVPLTVGTWDIEALEVLAASPSTTGGVRSKADITGSGTATYYGTTWRDGYTGDLTTTSVAASSAAATGGSAATLIAERLSAGISAKVTRIGTVIVTSGTVNFNVYAAQETASAGNSVIAMPGSKIIATKN